MVDTDTNPLPIVVKIAPDMTAEQAAEIGLHGIIAKNTTIACDGLTTPAERLDADGYASIEDAVGAAHREG